MDVAWPAVSSMRVRRHCSRSKGRFGPAPDRMHGSGLLVLQRRGWMALLAERRSRRSPGDLVRIAGRAGFPRQEIPGKRSRVLRGGIPRGDSRAMAS